MQIRRTLFPMMLLLVLLFPGHPFAGTIDHRNAFSRLLPDGELLYMPERFAPCLGCHPKALAEEEDFNANTLFRDMGLGKNLHWIHVFRQPKGTNCSACHQVDATTGVPSFLPGIRLEMSDKVNRCAPPATVRRNTATPGRESNRFRPSLPKSKRTPAYSSFFGHPQRALALRSATAAAFANDMSNSRSSPENPPTW